MGAAGQPPPHLVPQEGTLEGGGLVEYVRQLAVVRLSEPFIVASNREVPNPEHVTPLSTQITALAVAPTGRFPPSVPRSSLFNGRVFRAVFPARYTGCTSGPGLLRVLDQGVVSA